MDLTTRLGNAALFLRIAGSIAAWPICNWLGIPELGLFSCIVWFFSCGALLRHGIFPAIIQSVQCNGCRRPVSLRSRWKCGDHYTAGTVEHALTFRCPEGHRLGSINCIRCNTTIVLQRGDAKTLRHGFALALPKEHLLPIHADGSLHIGFDADNRPIGIPPSVQAWHSAILGGTGRGKSTMLSNMAIQLAEMGEGFSVLDPAGDLAETILARIPPHRERDVCYLDLADAANPFPLNILHADDPAKAPLLVEELLAVFRNTHSASWGAVIDYQLRMAMRTASAAGGSIRDVYSYFADPHAATRVLPLLHDETLRNFWQHTFATIPADRKLSVVNKLAPIVFHPVLGAVLGAPICGLDANDLIARRRIFIARLTTGTPGESTVGLIGTFLVHKLLSAAFAQGRLPPNRRVKHHLIVDEFGRFMNQTIGFDQILAGARAFRLSLIAATQFVDQLSAEVRAAIFGNVGALISFRVGTKDARALADEFDMSKLDAMTGLGVGQCVVRIGTTSAPIRTLSPPPPLADDPSRRIVAHSLASHPIIVRPATAPVVVHRERAPLPPRPPEEFVH